ncbi:MAG: Mov34/MPN/PAD-1 family protein [Nitrospirae bacterium]|nr:Mov34/MPN/PAD-1 family protein [Candidatus Manganitrophaceae bacterium]
MNFSIAAITRLLLAPRHELSCPFWIWQRLLKELRERGRGIRESGAFLLGNQNPSGRRTIVDFLLYDDLDPHALDTGIVHLDGRHFGKLWDLCKARNLTVVGDIHTHPSSASQSDSDRAHPIIARAGHIALVAPNFAAAPVTQLALGIYRYSGGGQWEVVPIERRRKFFHIGL